MADDGRVQERLAAATEAVRERDSLLSRRAAGQAQVDEATAQLAACRSRLADESEDVAELESFSLARIVAGVRGTRDADLSREVAEREAARFAVATAEHRRDATLRDVAQLDARLDRLAGVDAELGAALAAKEAWVTVGGQPGAARLAEIATRRGTIAAELREGHEAAVAGQRAAELLDQAAERLGRADDWSSYDTWFGGGYLASSFKHDHMDAASAIMRRADGALLALRRELADVGRAGVAQLEMGTWERTFDVFFDNIFTDVQVRDQVKGAIAKVQQARRAVHQVRRDLQARAGELSAELAALEAERRQLLS